jgi:hypothetical protein
MKKNLLLGFLAFLFTTAVFAQGKKEWYEFKIYSFDKPGQEKRVDDYLKNAYLPALHKQGIKNVGVFKPLETDSTFGKKLYVLIGYPSLEKFSNLQTILIKDKDFQNNGKDYLDAAHDNVTFKRIESILLQAFPLHPNLKTPNLKGSRAERVYELRSYEGPTEMRNTNKIKMFNNGDEIGLFARLGFNAVFYGEVFSGPRMPNLMYMTTFENQKERDEHWKAFSADPQWAKLKSDPQYQNNVSKADIIFLRPTEYSDY